MGDFSFEEVAGMARANGLVLTNEDLIEVTHRLNASIAGIEQFSHPELDSIDPLPFRPLEEMDDDR